MMQEKMELCARIYKGGGGEKLRKKKYSKLPLLFYAPRISERRQEFLKRTENFYNAPRISEVGTPRMSKMPQEFLKMNLEFL